MPFSRTSHAWKSQHFNVMTFQDFPGLYEPWLVDCHRRCADEDVASGFQQRRPRRIANEPQVWRACVLRDCPSSMEGSNNRASKLTRTKSTFKRGFKTFLFKSAFDVLYERNVWRFDCGMHHRSNCIGGARQIQPLLLILEDTAISYGLQSKSLYVINVFDFYILRTNESS